jgi:Lon protease-like protein
MMTDPTQHPPSELAIFPLNLVLFPGGPLPLKIFEQRYLEMTKACLRDDAPFGVCLIRSGREVGAPAEHEHIGCSARIAQWDMPHTGMFHLACVGERVFRLLESHTGKNGLIHGRVEWLDSADDQIDPQHLQACRSVLEALVKRAGENIFSGPAAFDDPEWISYRLAELLPADPPSKQVLLEQRGTGQRLATISRALQSVA